MKILLKRRAILIATASVLIAIITLVSVNVFNTSGPVAGAVNIVSNPLRLLTANVARTFEGIYNSIYRYESLRLEHDALLRTMAEWDRDERESAEIAAENDMLRSLLGFRTRHAEYVDEAATVEGWSSSNWVSEFFINRGYSNSAIAVGNAVVTEYGMVIGQISQVESTRSTVITVLDTRFSLSANVGDTDVVGTLRGDFNYMHQGLIVLDHLSADAAIMVGNHVMTSGEGGIFPPGHMVGEIVELHRHSTGIGRYATVMPVRDINTISNVFVIVEFGEASLDIY